MDSRIRIGIIVIIIGAVLTGTGFLVVNQIYTQSLEAQNQEMESVVITDSVVILSHDISLGALLTFDDVAIK